jgi:uncharacterized protein (DUF427 family)
MSVREIKQPGRSHPITIEPNPARIVVSVFGRVVADTRGALTLHEAGHRPVQYIPLADVEPSMLEASDHATYCPYKGECNYYDISVGGERAANAVWEYRDPYPAVAAITDRVAFYPDRVELVEAPPTD